MLPPNEPKVPEVEPELSFRTSSVKGREGNREMSRKRGRRESRDPPLSRSSSRSCKKRAMMQRASLDWGLPCVDNDNILILVDWDDTLLPSTWILQQGLRLDGPLPTKEQGELLCAAARESARTLKAAKRLGTVVIVTNAELGWVELSCSRFTPGLLPILEGVKIQSARSSYERPDLSSPLSWKHLAFCDELDSFCRRAELGAGRKVNVISVGDSLHEREALIKATDPLTDCWGKSVKIMERPSLELFKKEHEFLTLCLQSIVEHPGKLDLCVRFDHDQP